MIREDELGCFASLSGAFPSVFVQAVRVAVDLEQNLMLGSLLEKKSLENRRKNPEPIYKAEKN